MERRCSAQVFRGGCIRIAKRQGELRHIPRESPGQSRAWTHIGDGPRQSETAMIASILPPKVPCASSQAPWRVRPSKGAPRPPEDKEGCACARPCGKESSPVEKS